ncbi:glycosyltransferase [Parvibaculum sp.]|uniref:glycosyltransferase family 2 protein n=1 Tax=Parvibaculum sp. TaxID=2024848 RepID=UPI00320D1585
MHISVIMTCHNEERFVEQAIRSVVAQTARGDIDEILVVDDGSTDGSAALLKKLATEIPELRIVTLSGVGLPAARNRAIRETRGDLIAILDGDDFWAPDKLARQCPAFDLDERIGLVYSDYVDFTRADLSDAQPIAVRRFSETTPDMLAEYFVHDGPIVPSAVVLRRAALDEVGLFDEDIRLGEDTEMFLRLAERWKFRHVPGALCFKRRHSSNLTRRLDTLLPVAARMTERFVARNPRLAPLADRRMARRYARTGNDCAQHGEKRKAITLLIKAIRLDPLFWRPYVYLVLALVPRRLSGFLRLAAKAVFHFRRISSKPESAL